jgi:hypothetical protein
MLDRFAVPLGATLSFNLYRSHVETYVEFILPIETQD